MALAAGCQSASSSPDGAKKLTVQAVDIDQSPQDVAEPLRLSAAKNEWISFTLRIANLGLAGPTPKLQLYASPAIGLENLSAYQVLPMPVDTSGAGYVRETGLAAGSTRLPRALLPMSCHDGVVDLTSLRDPSHPFNPQSHPAGEPAVVWIDLHIPSDAAAGDYTISCSPDLEIPLHVYDFTIPQTRQLLMVGDLDWDRLQQLYADNFEAITPRLMSRGDPTYAPAIATIDQLIALAQQNRVEAVVPRLQPTVKWPAGMYPRVDWSDFDGVVSPWLSGEMFTDKTPLGYWPLPSVDYLDNYDPASQRAYWSNAAAHFNQQNWLEQSAVFLHKRSPGRATALESIQLCMSARSILDAHPLMRLGLPLEDDQIQFASSDNPSLLKPDMVSRIISLSPGLVFGSPAQSWPAELSRPAHWLEADDSPLSSYIGAGTDEQDVRLWAWLAFLRRADLVRWSGALPDWNDPSKPADPSRLTWFYPGSWFGLAEPVASVQLKWLRRAEEDYEYLRLAQERGKQTDALLLARLIARQVQLEPVQALDPEYDLLSGTADAATYREARELLARAIQVCPPDSSPDDPDVRRRDAQLSLDIDRWQEPKERPYILPRTAQWSWDDPGRSNGDQWAALRLGVDVYNAGDNRPDGNQLLWSRAGNAWQFKPQPEFIGALKTYSVQRFSINARVDLDQITSNSSQPIEIAFVDGYTRREFPARAMLPVANSIRREGNLRIDGNLDDWSSDDLIHDGPLTKMIDRPSIQQWRIEPASSPSQIYTGWSEDHFYIAFHVEGVSSQQEFHRNYIDYQFRRAWGEDLCEMLIQPINDDNSLGPMTYLACKPNGVCVVKRRLDPRTNLDAWHDIDAIAVRYAAQTPPGNWTGEIAIPWQLLLDGNSPGGNSPRPRLLRFNFIQHKQSTGESASWAGPIDFDQDDSFMGLLYLQELDTSGMHREALGK